MFLRDKMRGLIVVIALFTLGTFFFATNTSAQTFTRSVFVQNVTTNSVDLRWKTSTNASVTVRYGTTTAYGQQVTSDTVTQSPAASNNHARITGLQPNTKYFYQLVAGTTNLTPAGDQEYFFKTAPTSCTTADPCTFAVIGDSGEASTEQKNIASAMDARNPDVFIVVGDIVYDYSSNPETNDQRHFDIYANMMRNTPYYGMCGNHDSSECSTAISDQTLPQNGNASGVSTFSWDYGDIHFNATNSNAAHASTSPQIVWMKNDLQGSNKPFKIAMWHHNYWSAGSHSTQSGYEPMVRAASDAGTDVVFWGHSHVYERWEADPTYPNLRLFTIGNGGNTGGSSCTTSSPGPGCDQKSSSGDSAGGFLFGTVAGNQMTIQYHTQSGSTNGFPPLVLSSNGTGPTSPPVTNPPATNTPTRPPNATNTPTNRPVTNTPRPTGTLGNGDANCDNTINGADYVVWASFYNQSPQGCPQDADFNNDNIVDGIDFAIWLANYQGSSGGPSVNILSPSDGSTVSPNFQIQFNVSNFPL